MLFTFDEMRIFDGTKTGSAEGYDASSSQEAVRMCLERHWNASNGVAEIGPTGHVIYPRGRHGGTALVLRRE